MNECFLLLRFLDECQCLLERQCLCCQEASSNLHKIPVALERIRYYSGQGGGAVIAEQGRDGPGHDVPVEQGHVQIPRLQHHGGQVVTENNK